MGLIACALLPPASAQAGPVATSDGEYTAYGRVFPDPQGADCAPPCSPNRQGNVSARSFIGYDEFVGAMTFMNSKPEWRRYLEVWPLDTGRFAGNDLGKVEFRPSSRFVSAGLPTSTLDRKRHDLYVLRVTDERVPDRGKKRYVLSLSIHGIERAGLEGGVRAMEDLVTAATKDRLGRRILGTKGLSLDTPTFRDALRESIVYFTFPNPDGWARGDIATGGLVYQRYNGNGVDLNRDWPDKGFSFRPYSSLSEPETRGFASFFAAVARDHGRFHAGDDLHGQLGADAFSFTLIPHGFHNYGKNTRIRETSKSINLVQQDVLSWSPLIQPNSEPRGNCVDNPVSGSDCTPMYGQTWGTVYDTINYTTTGALGDYFDSRVGLRADGIDNEMSYSHLTKNNAFDPHIEQLHVDGNVGLIYAHLAELLNTRPEVFPAAGRKGFVANRRIRQGARTRTIGAPPGTRPQSDIDETAPGTPASAAFEFDVRRSSSIYNGGMRVDVTTPNFQAVSPSAVTHTLKVQCKGCDRHPGVEEEEDWVTVTQDFNQSPLYAQSGLTAAVNDPQPDSEGKPVRWRALVENPGGPAIRVHVEFSSGPAASSGETGGGAPPRTEAYDVASSDFWGDLNRFTPEVNRFRTVDPDRLARTRAAQVSDSLDTLVLTDEPLPGFQYKPPTVDPTRQKDLSFQSQRPTAPCGYQEGVSRDVPSCYETFEFKIRAGASKATVRIDFNAPNDLALEVVRVTPEGEESVGFQDGGEPSETVPIDEPKAGDYKAYVGNFAAADSSWTGSVKFGPQIVSTRKSRYSDTQYQRYADKMERFVRDGGNLVLTDGALQLLPDLFSQIKRTDVSKRTVYTGQVTFSKEASDSQEPGQPGNTLGDPLARNVRQQGARFNKGLRRQTFEPTPIGFSIQNAETGADESHARQWEVSRKAFEAAGGRVAGTGVDSGTREASAVDNVATLGELRLGRGRVRIVGALLPQPTEEYDHEQGLEPYAVTYTGFFLAENLTDYCRPGAEICFRPGDDLTGCRDRTPPISRFARRRSLRITRRKITIRGSARDRGCGGRRGKIKRVTIAIARRKGRRSSKCRHLQRNGRLGRTTKCRRAKYLRARGRSRFKLNRRARLLRGTYTVRIRAIDSAGNVERKRRKTGRKRNFRVFRVRRR